MERGVVPDVTRGREGDARPRACRSVPPPDL